MEKLVYEIVLYVNSPFKVTASSLTRLYTITLLFSQMLAFRDLVQVFPFNHFCSIGITGPQTNPDGYSLVNTV